MTWECAECDVAERRDTDRTSRIDGVCHHCGKPLCRKDQVLIADDAFAAAPGEASQEAVHCQECSRLRHSTHISLGRERR
jgi:hypothetical protein